MGLIQSTISESFPPKPHFKVEDIPDLTGKVAIVTGGNAGIGKATVKALLSRNARVYLAARNKSKAEAAIASLKQDTRCKDENIVLLELDLADLDSIERAAKEFRSKEGELHMLFNNAGVMGPPNELLTVQGYDLQFGTNVLGHFYLTKLLLPTLLSTAKSAPEWKPRVVTTSSISSRMPFSPDFNTFKDSPARRRKFWIQLYGQSKLANIMVSNEFAKRYGDEGLAFSSVNPGNIRTDLYQHTFASGLVKGLIGNIMLHPAHLGALTQLWAGASEEGGSMNGKYLVPWARISTPNPIALDEEGRKVLWEWLEEQVADRLSAQ
ncbi:hypothetical protein H1R20_g6176, partial [Candolleomyces eurysporus]